MHSYARPRTILIVIDFAIEYADIVVAGRTDQTRQTENHDHLHDRRSLQRRCHQINTIENRKRTRFPMAVAAQTQASGIVQILCDNPVAYPRARE